MLLLVLLLTTLDLVTLRRIECLLDLIDLLLNLLIPFLPLLNLLIPLTPPLDTIDLL